MCVYVCVCVHVCMCACVYVCMCVYVRAYVRICFVYNPFFCVEGFEATRKHGRIYATAITILTSNMYVWPSCGYMESHRNTMCGPHHEHCGQNTASVLLVIGVLMMPHQTGPKLHRTTSDPASTAPQYEVDTRFEEPSRSHVIGL